MKVVQDLLKLLLSSPLSPIGRTSESSKKEKVCSNSSRIRGSFECVQSAVEHDAVYLFDRLVDQQPKNMTAEREGVKSYSRKNWY